MELSNAVFIGSFYQIEQLPLDGFPQIVFAGRSNVGKSSLINRILNRKNLAHVAKTPGKTRALNFYEIDRRCYFVDLPGYGFARVSKQEQLAWRNLIDLYIEHTKTIKGVVHVIDSRRGLTVDDLELINYIRAPYSRFFWVLSKSDKLSNQEKKNVYTDTLDRLNCSPKDIVLFSAVDGAGVNDIRKKIIEMLRK